MDDDKHLRIGDPFRPYIQDATDEAAAAMYAARGFNPPEKPDGFLDDDEVGSWERWRKAAEPK
jgi:hypothetical protein